MVFYSPEISDEICRLLNEGMSLNQVCKREGMPSRSYVHEWIVQNRDGFGDKYARATEIRAERFGDEIIEISDDTSRDWIKTDDGPVLDHEHVQRSKLRVDSRKWLMARMAPKKYGEKVVLAGDAENPVKVTARIEMVPVEPQRRND